MLLNGLLLGLANGISCLATCSAILIPLFLGEGGRVHQNSKLLVGFLGGRLVGYLLFGVLAWAMGWLLLREPSMQSILGGVAYLVLAGFMASYGLRKPAPCLTSPHHLRTRLSRFPWLFPLVLGLLTGLNLCPPFLLAFTNAALNGTLLGSLLFFLAFFIGTSIYLIPVPLLGAIRKPASTQLIGKMAAGLMALFYIVSGIIMIYQGVVL